MQEYPKQLYRKGWDDLSDSVVVENESEEAEARVAGFKMLSEGDEAQPDDQEAPAKRGRKPKTEE